MLENACSQVVVINPDEDPSPVFLSELPSYNEQKANGLILILENNRASIAETFWQKLIKQLSNFIKESDQPLAQFFIQVQDQSSVPTELFKKEFLNELKTVGVSCNLNEESWDAFIKFIFNHPPLFAATYIGNLGNNQFKKLLEQFEKNNPTFQQLTLQHTQLTTHHATLLLNAIINSNILQLNLAWNPITAEKKEDFENFWQAACQSKNLRDLHLTSVSNDEAAIIANNSHALNHPLRLHLADNEKINEQCILLLKQAMQNNPFLTIRITHLNVELSKLQATHALEIQTEKQSIPRLFWLTLSKLLNDEELSSEVEEMELDTLPLNTYTTYLQTQLAKQSNNVVTSTINEQTGELGHRRSLQI